ncbi:uncharacterized protein Gasu_27770 [Galdieria sulphuraria]|uniref:Uncharacterized protein n=1 Tax=Galdieria sulphuraria TaxID=130081 RepID=M2X0B6_GALSU|nr:uncharacterized protein Gasu_27770 [Galdieria sulphuraria]EME29775.1 hypothetical protein Gasu_27770 [Galdieria sulphuraria]|eukprot:XP_005706295.1 hypothetical protein Gasu_27770 [Galdieria sulphuraria]
MSTYLCRECNRHIDFCFVTVCCSTRLTTGLLSGRLKTILSRRGFYGHFSKWVCSGSYPKLSLLACAKNRDNVERFRENLERSLGEAKHSYRKTLDGVQLRELLLQRYGLSYDIRLKVTPWFSGKYLLTANIMWLYVEQQSFPLTEHEYLCHLEAIAQYLNNWGVVNQFIDFLQSTKQKPRVAKAVSVPLDVSQEEIVEFMNCHK